MTYIKRAVEDFIKEMLGQFKVVLVTGARQTGKTTMLRHMLDKKMAKSFGRIQSVPGFTAGHGCILCLAENRKELSDSVTALPLEYL